jgi:NAD(P)-dependent dehydrogenase (short-subunit alcohol dehydrogenase family)
MPPARRALVVGNSDGIGLALTKRLLADGWTVVGLSRRPSPLPAAAYPLMSPLNAPEHRSLPLRAESTATARTTALLRTWLLPARGLQ